MRLIIIAAVLSLILPPFHAFSQSVSPTPTPFPSPTAVPLAANDFDGDGISDIALYSNQNDGSPNEYIYSFDFSGDGVPSLDDLEFGSSGDIMVPGRYDGTQSDLGVVKQGETSLTWVLRSTEDRDIIDRIEFGEPGDTAIGGCDFDGDSLSDLAVLHEGVLRIRQSSDESVSEIPMNMREGSELKDISCADINGDSLAELLMLVKEVPTREELGLVRCKQAFKAKRKRRVCRRENKAKRAAAKNTVTAKSFELFLSEGYASTLSRDNAKRGKRILAALDVDNDGELETAYSRKISRAAHRVNFFAGDQTIPVDLPPIKDISFGVFEDGVPGIVVLGKNRSIYVVSLPSLEVSVREVDAQGDRLLKSVNAATAGASLGETPTTCSKFVRVGDGFLWKPVSESTHKLVVLLPTTYRKRINSVSVVFGDQNVETLAFAGDTHNGFRPHYRSFSKAGRNFPDGSYVAVNTKSDGVHCIGPIEDTSNRAE